MSTTSNLGLFKHDNPKTNTDKFDIDKALNQNWDKIDEACGNKVDKIEGKQLSTEDYTTAEKTKLEGLENYDDTGIKEDISDLESKTLTILEEEEIEYDEE